METPNDNNEQSREACGRSASAGYVAEYRNRVIQMCDERDEFGPLEDGYVYYWPSAKQGAIAAEELRIIADELDRRNAEWDAQVQRDIAT